MSIVDMGKENYRFKCDSCGKFVKYETCHVEFTPDTEFTTESIEHYCQPCQKKWME